MINVLHLRDTDRVCGPGKTIMETVARIDKDRYNVSIGLLMRSSEKENAYLDACLRRGVRIEPIYALHQFDPSIVFKIAAKVKSDGVDILHAHEYKSDIIAYLVSKLVPVSIVTTAHGWISNSFKSRVYIWLQKKVFPKFDRIIAVSPKIESEILRTGTPRESVELIFNAIVVENYNPDEHERGYLRKRFSIPDDGIIVGNVGRLSPEKGQPVFIEAAKKVLQEVPNAYFVLVGDGVTRPELEALARTNGISQRVFFTGHMSDVRPAFRDMDVFALTSHTEGFPNVVLESLCMGIPVVATDVGGVAEIVIDGETGHLVTDRDIGGIARAIVRLATDRQHALQTVVNGRRMVNERYHFSARVQKIQDLYDRVYQRRAGT